MAGKTKDVNCDDKKCPVHGGTKLRGFKIKGIVVASDAYRSATIMIEKTIFSKKYERYEKGKKKIRVHNPPCINAKEGDWVIVKECRPLSKTKHFVIIEKIGSDYLFEEKERAMEESKVKKKPKVEAKEEDASSESESN